MPPLLHSLPKRYWAHASEAIDFQALQGKRVAVLGAAATAMDNAAAALEHGASAVEQYCRRARVQSIQPYRWSAFAGFMRHIGEMDDLWRWRFLTYFLELREPFTKDAWSRVSRFPNYRMVTGRPWERLGLADGRIVNRHPAVAEQAPTSSSPARGSKSTIGCGPSFPILPIRSRRGTIASNLLPARKTRGSGFIPIFRRPSPSSSAKPGAAPALRNIHCFNFASTLSFGPSGAAIRPMKYLVPKLVRSLTRDLFRDDLDAHWQSFRTFRGHDFEGFPETLGTEE